MEINVYQDSFAYKEINLRICILVILFFILILSLIIIFNNNFYDYYTGLALIEDNNKISTLINIDDLNKITNNKEIIVERTTFSYTVDFIDDIDYVYGDNIYKKVYLKVDLKNNINIVNNKFSYEIILKKDTILNYVFDTIKGGVM